MRIGFSTKKTSIVISNHPSNTISPVILDSFFLFAHESIKLRTSDEENKKAHS